MKAVRCAGWGLGLCLENMSSSKIILKRVEVMKIFFHHTMVALCTIEKKMLENLSKQSDYDNKIPVTEWQSNPKDSD